MGHIALGLAVLHLIVAIPALFDQKKFREGMLELIDSSNVVLRGVGFIHLLIAFFIFNTHWTVKLDDSRSIMTVLAYLMVFKGLMCIWFTNAFRALVRSFVKKNYSALLGGFLSLAVAVGLGYLGRYVY